MAHVDDGAHYSFSLRVEAGRIIFEYQVNVNVTRRLALETELEHDGTTYQIDLLTSSQSAQLVLLNASDTLWPVFVEERSTEVRDTLYPPSTIFTTVCVGGSLLEYDNYLGTIQSAFYSYNSLLEERNFRRMATEGVRKLDLMVFANNGVARELVFERFPLGSHRIRFQHRSRVEYQIGIFVAVRSDLYGFFLTAFRGQVLAILLSTDLHNLGMASKLCGEGLFDGEWHSYQISLDVETGNLTLAVDDDICIFGGTKFSRTAFQELANSALKFGASDPLYMGPGRIRPAVFTGCVSGIELQRTSDSEIFRPNLEAVARRNSDTFEVDVCYHCTAARERSCGNGRVCTDRASGVDTTCKCPDGVIGQMCDVD